MNSTNDRSSESSSLESTAEIARSDSALPETAGGEVDGLPKADSAAKRSVPLEVTTEPKYRLDFIFNRLHDSLDWVQDVLEVAVDIFLRIFMTNPVQFVAGALTGVFCLLLAYQILLFVFGLFMLWS